MQFLPKKIEEEKTPQVSITLIPKPDQKKY